MRRLIAALALALPMPALADEAVTSFALDNGLEVVVIEDHRAPAAVHMLWYRAGSADEPPGRSGIAHYLEHLLFKATDELEAGEFSDTVAALGGTDNAFTSYDYTAYFQRVAAEHLGLMMEMEADRMTDLALDAEDILTERDVVIEERRQRTDNDPGALFSEQRRAAQYLNHPYGVPVIGWAQEADALTLDDALEFYGAHYAPNNAVLVVAGDVFPGEVRDLAEEHYGPIPADPAIAPRERPQEPPQLAERRIAFEDPRVGQPYVVRTYLAPERDAGDQREAAALTLAAALLGGSAQTAVLPQKLQFENEDALYATAFYDGLSYDDTLFGVLVVPAPGVTLEEGEEALDRALAEFLEEGVDEDQLERVKFQFEAARIYAQDDPGSRARTYGAALTSGLTVRDVQDWPGIIQSITPEEIEDALARVLDRDRAVTGYLTTTEPAAFEPVPASAADPAAGAPPPPPAGLPAEPAGDAATVLEDS
ncbi:zinc protease [Hasllibacter halocynthiae]|uniref:Zinc protease n=1 Tax=Hasllibacter halocynthiae TaxID=595589 RepID=A0A2T0X3N4_9RHOB|nr:pitrilysin family protein [Hasllibacter halocynthiae]PRY93563.1 zinc protease [Hasllibacter halocynthiae]